MVIGTIAEFIKLAPVIIELQSSGAKVVPIATGQNNIRKSDLYPVVFPDGVEYFVTDRKIKQTPFHFFLWVIECFIKTFFVLKKSFDTEVSKDSIANQNKNCIKRDEVYLLVHGDTVSTFIGAFVGWLIGASVVHIEAGLRSFNLFRPFPEELCRIFVSKFAKVAFCPGQWACENIKNNTKLKHVDVVDTVENTLIDSMRMALSSEVGVSVCKNLPEKYFLFVCHRQENLYDKDFLHKMFLRIAKISDAIQCVAILHEPAEVALRSMGLLEYFENIPNIKIYPRQSYYEFTNILNKASFVVTDGGSNQEECYFLGKACLILRKETERREGLNFNAILSLKDFSIIDDFLASPYRWTQFPVDSKVKPSSIVSNYLMGI